MPLYEYRCEECRRVFSILVGVSAERAVLRCPGCGSKRATKLISRIAPVVREDDFDDSDLDDDYADDYDGDYDDSFDD